MTTQDIIFREHVQPGDDEEVRAVVSSTGFFSGDEIEVAVELVQERLAKGAASGYEFLFAEQSGDMVGYACFGPIAGTAVSYDLYWIAVRRQIRGRGIGSALLAAAERRISAGGGRRVYIETSSRPQYAPTRAFYKRCGYRREALLKDFYAPGDGKVIYVKALNAALVSACTGRKQQMAPLFLQRRRQWNWDHGA